METKTLHAVNRLLDKTAGVRLSVNPLVDALNAGIYKRASEEQVVEQSRAGGSPGNSNGGSKGMEDKNSGYGKTTDVLEDDPEKGGDNMGRPVVSHAGVHITTEVDGMKDLSLSQEKSAAMSFLRATNPRATNQARLAHYLRSR